MNRFRLMIVTCALLVAALSIAAHAALTGKVVNQSATPLANATARLVNANKTTATGTDGRFSFVAVGAELPAATVKKVCAPTVVNGGISFTVASEAMRVSIRLFDISGRQVAPAFSRLLSTGEYRYDPFSALNGAATGEMFIARVSLDGQTYSLKILPQFGQRMRSQIFRNGGASGFGLVKRAAVIDTLKVFLTGYQPTSMAVSTYDGDMGDIALTPLTYTLTVASNPTAGGTVAKSPNQTSYNYGTVVTLTASPASGYGFTSWSGDATGTTPSVQVTMTANRSVTANFMAAPTLTGPSTATGSFLVTCTYGWGSLASTNDCFSLEYSTTSSTSGFSVLANSPVGTHPSPYSFTVTPSGTGTYYLRVRAYTYQGYTSYSEVLTVTVTIPTTATIRVVNNTKYDAFSVRLNNVQKLASGYVVLTGSSADFQVASGGTVSYSISVGFMDTYGATTDFFDYNGTVQATVGQVSTITLTNPTIGQLLSGFGASKNWVGDYWDANMGLHYATYTFYSNGAYQLYDDGVQIGSGSVSLVSWPTYGAIIQFSIGGSAAINLAYPFGSFQQRNGPASWPIIQYTAQ